MGAVSISDMSEQATVTVIRSGGPNSSVSALIMRTPEGELYFFDRSQGSRWVRHLTRHVSFVDALVERGIEAWRKE